VDRQTLRIAVIAVVAVAAFKFAQSRVPALRAVKV
jgi:hypothetical protein